MRALDADALEATLAEAATRSLDAHCVENAIFLSERLRAVRDSDANALLHARCLYAAGKARAARAVLGTRLTSQRDERKSFQSNRKNSKCL